MNDLSPDPSLLVEQLASLGVRTLRVREAAATYAVPDPSQLIRDLATHPEPRLREAITPLFLRHPEYASLIVPIVSSLEPADAERLAACTRQPFSYTASGAARWASTWARRHFCPIILARYGVCRLPMRILARPGCGLWQNYTNVKPALNG